MFACVTALIAVLILLSGASTQEVGPSAHPGTAATSARQPFLPLVFKAFAPPPSPTPTATATPIATASRTPTPIDTATPTPTPNPNLLFFDDFSDPRSGWPIFSCADATVGYLDGEYQILVHRLYYYQPANPGVGGEDIRICVGLRFASTALGSAGPAFGITESGEAYVLHITNNGQYALFKRLVGGWETLIPWTFAPCINPGMENNYFVVEREGTNIRAWINGPLLIDIYDSSFTGKLEVGLSACAYAKAPVDARFDNYALYTLRLPASLSARNRSPVAS